MSLRDGYTVTPVVLSDLDVALGAAEAWLVQGDARDMAIVARKANGGGFVCSRCHHAILCPHVAAARLEHRERPNDWPPAA